MIAIVNIIKNSTKAKWLSMYGYNVKTNVYSFNLPVSTIDDIIEKLKFDNCSGHCVKYCKHKMEPEIVDF